VKKCGFTGPGFAGKEYIFCGILQESVREGEFGIVLLLVFHVFVPDEGK
jgi:hypothetical protein